MNTQFSDSFESEGSGVTWAYVICHIHASGQNFDTCPKDDTTDFTHRDLLFLFLFSALICLIWIRSYICMALTDRLQIELTFPQWISNVPMNHMNDRTFQLHQILENHQHKPPNYIPCNWRNINCEQHNWIVKDLVQFVHLGRGDVESWHKAMPTLEQIMFEDCCCMTAFISGIR